MQNIFISTYTNVWSWFIPATKLCEYVALRQALVFLPVFWQSALLILIWEKVIHSLSCLVVVVMRLGTTVAGMKIRRPVWTGKRESISNRSQSVSVLGQIFLSLFLGKEEAHLISK